MRVGELGLEIEPAHSRHAHVQHETADRVGGLSLQELTGRAKDLGSQADRLQQRLQALAHVHVVVDHEDDRRSMVSSCVTGPPHAARRIAELIAATIVLEHLVLRHAGSHPASRNHMPPRACQTGDDDRQRRQNAPDDRSPGPTKRGGHSMRHSAAVPVNSGFTRILYQGLIEKTKILRRKSILASICILYVKGKAWASRCRHARPCGQYASATKRLAARPAWSSYFPLFGRFGSFTGSRP